MSILPSLYLLEPFFSDHLSFQINFLKLLLSLSVSTVFKCLKICSGCFTLCSLIFFLFVFIISPNLHSSSQGGKRRRQTYPSPPVLSPHVLPSHISRNIVAHSAQQCMHGDMTNTQWCDTYKRLHSVKMQVSLSHTDQHKQTHKYKAFIFNNCYWPFQVCQLSIPTPSRTPTAMERNKICHLVSSYTCPIFSFTYLYPCFMNIKLSVGHMCLYPWFSLKNNKYVSGVLGSCIFNNQKKHRIAWVLYICTVMFVSCMYCTTFKYRLLVDYCIVSAWYIGLTVNMQKITITLKFQLDWGQSGYSRVNVPH